MGSPTYEEVAAEMAGKSQFAKLNCDEQTSVTVQCKITGTSTVIIYLDGKEAERIVNRRAKDGLKDLLDK